MRMSKTDPRQLETYLERKEAYEGGLEPEVERLVDSLQEWQHEPGLQPRPGFLNELAQQLQAQEEAQPRANRAHHFWRRLGGFLLRGAAATVVTLAVITLFALWLASLSPQAGAPTAGSPVTQPTPFLSGAEPAELPEGSVLPDPGAAIRSGLSSMVQVVGTLIPWLLLASAILWLLAVLWRRRRAGRVVAVAGLVSLLLVIAVYPFAGVSWRVLPALLNGYHYDPNEEAPDERLVPRRPEVLVERQLAALVGERGPAPLRADAALVAYTIGRVHIEPWRSWPTAVVEATLTFADGSSRQVDLALPSRGGQYILFPLLGEVPASAFAWYPPEGSLGRFFGTPAPATPIDGGNPPLRLEPVYQVDAADVVRQVEPATSSVAASSISSDGDLLADVDLREEGRNVGYATLLHSAGGDHRELLVTSWAARAAFSPDGQRIAYVRGFNEYGLELVVRDADGSERSIASVNGLAHHWVGNQQIAYGRNGTAYLYNLRSGTEQPLAKLAPARFTASSYFHVLPKGRRIAYADFEGRLWVEEIGSGRRQHIGWDVNEVGWGNGIAWRPDGEQLVYTARNNTTLPDQQEVWLWDAASGQSALLARTGPGFLNADTEGVNLGKACWAGEETVLFAADLPQREEVRLIAARTDGSGLWDVTPKGATVPFPAIQCENGYAALNASRTTVTLHTITPGEPGTSARLPLADYPPRDTPYRVAAGDFWLVHTPEGDLFAFAPVSLEYKDDVTIEECRYDWNDAVGRFVDPCSGDEWELDGTLNLEHSTERWSNRDLDQYATSIEEGTITIYLDRAMPGTSRRE